MSCTIYKYPLPDVSKPFTINMPKNAKILSVQIHEKNHQPCLWVLCNPENEKIDRTFVMAGTGCELDDSFRDYRFIGTVQIDGFVWHYFEVIDIFEMLVDEVLHF